MRRMQQELQRLGGSLGGRGWRMPCGNRVSIKGMVNAEENMVSGSRGRQYPAG